MALQRGSSGLKPHRGHREGPEMVQVSRGREATGNPARVGLDDLVWWGGSVALVRFARDHGPHITGHSNAGSSSDHAVQWSGDCKAGFHQDDLR